MIRALIFDCFGVLVVDSAIGVHRDEAMMQFVAARQPTYKTALLSNISQNGLNHYFTADELAAYFSVAIATHEGSAPKPDPAAFLSVVGQLGVLPDEAVMIDDTAGHCAGARAAGLHAIQYRSLAQLQAELAALANSK